MNTNTTNKNNKKTDSISIESSEIESNAIESNAQKPPKPVIIALDIGLKRIGVAKFLSGIALLSEPILRKNRKEAAKEVSDLLAQSRAQIALFGLPNSEEMQRRIKHFSSLLNLPINCKIEFFDEDFSSKEASQKLAQISNKNNNKNNKNGKLDSHSALIILERYLSAKKLN